MLQNFWIGTDFANLLTSLTGGHANVQALLESQRKNLKALEQANQHAIEAFHAIFTRQNEILHAALQETSNAMAGLASKDANEALARQTEIAMAATSRTLDNLREVSEMVAQASQKAGLVLNKRFTENLEEIKALSERKK